MVDVQGTKDALYAYVEEFKPAPVAMEDWAGSVAREMLNAVSTLDDDEWDKGGNLLRRIWIAGYFIAPSPYFQIDSGRTRDQEYFRVLHQMQEKHDVDSLQQGLATVDNRDRDSVDLVLAKQRIDRWISAEFERYGPFRREGEPEQERLTFADKKVGLGITFPHYRDIEALHAQYERLRAADLITFQDEMRAAVRESQDALSATISARDSAKAAAGETGDAALSSSFSDDAASDGWKAFGLSFASVFALLCGCGIGVYVITGAENASVALFVGKLALTVPVFAIAAYMGRLASHYRDAARWAKTAAVQLKTLDAFIEGITDETAKNTLRAAVGARIFGEANFSGTPSIPELEEFTKLVETLGNVINKR